MRGFHFIRCLKRHVGVQLATCLWTLLVLPAPFQIHGQCQPADLAKVAPSQTDGGNSKTPQFYDEPQFTVAGVADATNLGGHGSDTVVRTKEALAKDTVSLARPEPVSPSTASPSDEKSLREALQREPQNAALHHTLGDLEEKQKHPLEAVGEYQRAAELNPSEPYLFDWGTELLAHRAPEAAIEVLNKGNRLFPTSMRMLVGLGVALHALGSYDRAADCLRAASDLNPNDPSPYLFLAKMDHAGTVQLPGVVDKLERFARLHPDNALANYYYGAALWKRAKGSADTVVAAQVQSLLNTSIRLDPKLGSAYLLQGVVDADRGDWAKAVGGYQKAIAASPDQEEAHYRLALAYRRLGQKEKAQRELQLYEQLSKKAKADAERERREVPQFVVALREAKPDPRP